MSAFRPQYSRNQHNLMVALLAIPASVFSFLIGMGTGAAFFYVLGAVGLLASGASIYLAAKKQAEKKRIAAEEAEIRAHQLRQARGQ